MIKIDRIDRKEALKYLACRDESSLSVTALEYFDECEKRVLEVIEPKFIYRYFPLSWKDGYPEITGCTLKLSGKDIAEHLADCEGVVLLCATVGSAADKLIRILQIEDMAKAVIADAFAGAAAEQTVNEAEKLIQEDIRDKYFTWRFSPGYGDFPINLQKELLKVLDAPRKIGLCASDSNMLTPIKSVTALMGVSDTPLPRKKSGCMSCSLMEVCQLRKRGVHCGY